MTITRDDIRAADGAGTLNEAQAVSIVALSDARRGAREKLQGLDEPFELLRGFNEVFIVVGLAILCGGWIAVATILLEGQAAMATLMLGFGLVLLGATWEKLRGWLMGALPGFPGKDRLPPWGLATTEDLTT